MKLLNKVSLFYVCSLLLLLFLVPIRAVYAQNFFIDDFDNIDTNVWNLFSNGGNISISSPGIIKISSPVSSFFPYVYRKFDLDTIDEYTLRTSFLIEGQLNYGSGLVLSDKIINNHTPLDLGPDDVIFQIWPEGQNMSNVWTTMCPESENGCSTSTYRKIFPAQNGTFHNLTIKYKGNKYFVSIDNEPEKIYLANKKINYFWFGNPQKTDTQTIRPSISIDYFRIEVPGIEKNVVVVLPGFAGSWDLGAILSGQPGTNWQIPPFVKEYDGIINSLVAAGYEKNKDFYIFPYDWRKSLDSLADDLNLFITSKNIGQRKIDFVGHSMGGLVARTYLQKYNNPAVNKVVTAGSPHKGIIDAYGLWEGATVWDAVWWQRVLLEIASEVNRQSGETKIQAVRRIAPSIKDLMPTENFLQNNGVSVPWNSLSWKNDFLANKNADLTNYLTKIAAGGSQDYAGTRKAINIEKPSNEDKLLGLWQDGKPKINNTFEFGPGDGFVTKGSSTDLFGNKMLLAGGHGETISSLANIKKILGEIKVASEGAVGSISDTRKSAFVAKLNSPGKLHVCLASVCDENLGLVFDTEKMVIVPGYTNAKYIVTVDSSGETGKYKLLLGEINNGGVWKSVGGSLSTTTQKDIYQYDTQTDQVSADIKTIENLLKIFWNKKPKLSEVYGIRQSILESIDKNIKESNYSEFDINLNKWQTLDYYVASEFSKDKFFGHDGWDLGIRKGKKSKYLQKTSNYFSASLTQLIKDKTVEYESIPYWQLKLKIDKMIQLVMLKAFVSA